MGSSDVIKRSNIYVAKRVEFEGYIPTIKFADHFHLPCSFFPVYFFLLEFWGLHNKSCMKNFVLRVILRGYMVT